MSKITGMLQGSEMVLRYTAIVHFAAESSLHQQVDALAHESNSLLSEAVKRVKTGFKDTAGSALKLTEMGNSDNIEMIQATAHSPRRVAYYRRVAKFRIDN